MTPQITQQITPQTTEDKFGKAWEKIQAEMGEKPEPKREPKKTLDKDDFLRIMVTQMQHQDPTKPFDSDRMMTELAQITSVEQLKNMNNKLEKVVDQDRPLERLAMTHLIGKQVTVDRNRFPHKEGLNTTVSFMLPETAQETHVKIVSETGELMFEKDLGRLATGTNSFTWDGKQTSSLPAKSGNYQLLVEAVSPVGTPIKADFQIRSRIIGVGFDGKEPVLLVGDPTKNERISMRNVIQIDGEFTPPEPLKGGDDT